MLTAERLRELLIYFPSTGEFRWRSGPGAPRAARLNRSAGTARKPRGELVLGVDNKIYLIHRLAWLYVHGEWPVRHIDHINGNPSDNRIANLRDVDRSTNLQNRRGPTRTNKSGLLGVRQRDGRWTAEIKIGGKNKQLGRYDTKESAYAAYLAAKREFHAGCTI